jgi:outer membrane protein assembly factor BamB
VADSFLCFAVADERKSGRYDYLMALNLRGEILWKFPRDNELWGIPLISPGGNVYMQTTSEYNKDGAYSISQNGEGKLIEWPDSIHPGSFLGFDSTENIIIWERHDKQIHIISDEGKEISSCFLEDVPYYMRQTPNILDFIISTADSNRLVKMDNKCNIVWDQKIDGPFNINCLTYFEGNRNLYIGTAEGTLYKLNADTGNFIWKCELGAEFGEIVDLFLSSEEIAFVSGFWERLAAIDRDGNLIWQHTMYNAGNISKSILTSNDQLLVIQEGRLYAFTNDPALFVSQKEPLPIPSSKSDAEDEIIKFMLEDIVGTIDYLYDWLKEKERIKNQPGYRPPDSDLIIYTYPTEDTDYVVSPIYSGEPVRAWLYDNLGLIEPENKDRTIDEYNEKIKNSKPVPWEYGKYVFGIKWISDDFTQAEVFLDHYCGGLCGGGSRLYLQRSPSGEWWVVKEIGTWIS